MKRTREGAEATTGVTTNLDIANPDVASPEPVSPEPVSPEPVSPEPVSPEPVSPEPASSPGSTAETQPYPIEPDGIEPDGAEADSVERLPTPEPIRRTVRLRRGVAPTGSTRTADARLSRLHLRGGLLTLARAELEQMAGAGTLDREALADLAEARWRSGDLEGAAEAADTHLATGGDEPIAHIIVAEQAEREGRILDARQHATLVQQRVGEGIERLFAGERRSTVWPVGTAGWMDTGAVAPGRWGLLVGGAEVADPDSTTWPSAPPMSTHDLDLARPGGPISRTGPARPGLAGSGATTEQLRDAGRDAAAHLDAAEQDLARGDLAAMVARLALLLRLDPTLAPVILSLCERAVADAAEVPADLARTANTASLQLLRGDIYRGLGRDTEAADAYQEALRALPGRAITMESSS